jgi:putative acetyltransferase
MNSVESKWPGVNPDSQPDNVVFEIRTDDLSGAAIIELLNEHLRCMAQVSPRESRHALDLAGLRQPDITFWSVWADAQLAGCGALRELDRQHGEIKSMRTAHGFHRKGVAKAMLVHIFEEARRRGYRRLSLETGSQVYFEPARRLYEGAGFVRCGPFAGYVVDPSSVFMTREL